MGDSEGNKNQDQVKHNPFWLDGHTFVYDPISKVYKAESERQNEQGREEGYRVSPVVPIGVVVKRDWLAFITSLLIGLGTFIVVARYTYYAGGQWDEMRKATVASTKASETAASALDENKRQFQETIAELRKQTNAQGVSGIAAQHAAKTAVDTLHISERAYITEGVAIIRPTLLAMDIPLINGGHLPSGRVDITLYEVTINFDKPTYHADIKVKDVTERHKGSNSIPQIVAGLPYFIAVPLPKLDTARVQNGTQAIFVMGRFSYNDGFPDTPIQHGLVCFQTVYSGVSKNTELSPCDANQMLPDLESWDWTNYSPK